jgi:hypothetical protein
LEAVVPEEPDELPELERRRAELYRELSQVGDFRPGSLNEVRRKCGKPNCACAAPGHPGHGPQYNLTRKVDGRTRAWHLRRGPELDKARREVAEYQRFWDLVGQVTEVNEAICGARPVTPGSAGDESPSGTGGGEGSPELMALAAQRLQAHIDRAGGQAGGGAPRAGQS